MQLISSSKKPPLSLSIFQGRPQLWMLNIALYCHVQCMEQTPNTLTVSSFLLCLCLCLSLLLLSSPLLPSSPLLLLLPPLPHQLPNLLSPTSSPTSSPPPRPLPASPPASKRPSSAGSGIVGGRRGLLVGGELTINVSVALHYGLHILWVGEPKQKMKGLSVCSKCIPCIYTCIHT